MILIYSMRLSIWMSEMWNKIFKKYQELKEAWNVRRARKARIVSLIAEMNQEVADAVDAKTKNHSPWWVGIGPVYSIDGTAKRLNLSTAEVENLIKNNKLLAVQAADTGAWFVPCAQLINGGTAIPEAIPWVLERLPEAIVDRATLAAWMNIQNLHLDGKTIWNLLASSPNGELTDEVKDLVDGFHHVASR